MINRNTFTGRNSFVAGCVIVFCCLTTGSQSATEHPLPKDPPTSKDAMTAPSERKPAADFHLTDNTGHVFHLSQQRGKVVILNFWATWCGGCKFELRYFVEYERKYHLQGLSTLGISMDDEGFKVVSPFWQQKQMPYSTVIGNDALAKRLGLTGMPFTLLIDREGRVAIAHNGVLNRNDFDQHIQQLLKS